MGLRAAQFPDLLRGLTLATIAKSFIPAAWLSFSVIYSRGDYRESLARWKIPLAVFALLPVGLSLAFRQQLLFITADPDSEALQLPFGPIAKALNLILLVALVWILMNLEQTFRSSVGTMRWRIKFVVLGLAVIFGARIYVHSQALLFSAYDTDWSVIESTALIIGCVFLVVAYLRTGLAEIDVYPSRVVLKSSLTVFIAGGYLFIVGVLARIVTLVGGVESFEIQAFIVLLGMAGLAVLLLSDRFRQRMHAFVSRHFARAQHDSARIWAEFSRRLADVKDQAGLCAASARLISETFEVLSVTIWLLDEHEERLVAGAATAAQTGEHACGSSSRTVSNAVASALRLRSSAFDLEAVKRAMGGGIAATQSDNVPERRPPLVSSVADRRTEPWGAGARRSRQWRRVYIRGTAATAMHRRAGDVSAAESPPRKRTRARQGTGGVPDHVGLLRT